MLVFTVRILYGDAPSNRLLPSSANPVQSSPIRRTLAVKTLPFLLCVDVEPDDRQVVGDPSADWSGTIPCLQRLDDFRSAIEQSTGNSVHLNWFPRIDPQIADAYGDAAYACKRFAAFWQQYKRAGDEIGVHVHAWRRTGKLAWVADYADTEWVRHCARVGIRTYEGAFGERPRSFRFGERYGSNDLYRTLETERIAYDLTLEPGKRVECDLPWATGPIPACQKMPRMPYRPSRADYLKRGIIYPRRLWILPASTGLQYAGGPIVHLCLGAKASMQSRVFERLLADPRTSHILYVARTGDFASAECRSEFLSSLDFLTNHPRRSDFRFVRPDEMLP